MKQIFRYILGPYNKANSCELVMPAGAEIVKVMPEGKDLCVYALIDMRQKITEKRRFFYADTGDVFNMDEWRYLSTLRVMLPNGSMSSYFHVLEMRL